MNTTRAAAADCSFSNPGIRSINTPRNQDSQKDRIVENAPRISLLELAVVAALLALAALLGSPTPAF
jgi:hypothetical protein